jgi:hypothetical protein
MEDSELWRGVVNCTHTGRFITEGVVRAVDGNDASEQLGRWFRNLDMGEQGGDWTLTSHRLVSRPPEVLLASRPWPLDPEHKHLERQPTQRSVPWQLRYR